jgi:hypothetical protein
VAALPLLTADEIGFSVLFVAEGPSFFTINQRAALEVAFFVWQWVWVAGM